MSFLDIQRVYQEQGLLPTDAQFNKWVDAALSEENQGGEIVIRIVDESESATLNQQYRKKTEPTNILSFTFDAPKNIDLNMLGDLVICAPVVNREAQQQNKAQNDHWAHITIHGVLHLEGYDHKEDSEAEDMELMEIEILKKLDIGNPYTLQEHQ
jgi:probable rRNA maturation factor